MSMYDYQNKRALPLKIIKVLGFLMDKNSDLLKQNYNIITNLDEIQSKNFIKIYDLLAAFNLVILIQRISQMVSLEFFVDIKSFRSHYGPGVDSTSNRNEYLEHFLGVKTAGA